MGFLSLRSSSYHFLAVLLLLLLLLPSFSKPSAQRQQRPILTFQSHLPTDLSSHLSSSSFSPPSSSELTSELTKLTSSLRSVASSSLDTLRNPTTSLTTNNLLISTSLIFLLQKLCPPLTRACCRSTALLKANPIGSVHRLIAPVFLHASLGHLAVNMYSLSNLGPAIDSIYGRSHFVPLYLVSGIGGNLLSTVLSRDLYSTGVGASGAIFGCLGAFYVHVSSQRPSRERDRAKERVRNTAALNLMYGLSTPGIDNLAHLGGLMAGAAYAWAVESGGRRKRKGR